MDQSFTEHEDFSAPRANDPDEVTVCPVCDEDCGTNAWLQEHMAAEGHIV